MSRTSNPSTTLNIVLIINDSPWGSTLAATAARIAGGFSKAGHRLQAVFFREDGVYHCISGTSAESGVPNLATTWAQLHEEHGAQLLVCQASAVRRLANAPPAPFRESGLVELADLVADSDRVITF